MVLSGHTGIVVYVMWSPDGRYLYLQATDATIRKWNADTGEAEWFGQRRCARRWRTPEKVGSLRLPASVRHNDTTLGMCAKCPLIVELRRSCAVS